MLSALRRSLSATVVKSRWVCAFPATSTWNGGRWYPWAIWSSRAMCAVALSKFLAIVTGIKVACRSRATRPTAPGVR